ncbi:hypothetical protein GCM10010236_74310 [Streptomyces eurythermus]|nr:hypothetical protein GCM10010236_74310 [Streptomyces eurythermus]
MNVAQVRLESVLDGDACVEDNDIGLLGGSTEVSEGQVHEAPTGGEEVALIHVFFHGDRGWSSGTCSSARRGLGAPTGRGRTP